MKNFSLFLLLFCITIAIAAAITIVIAVVVSPAVEESARKKTLQEQMWKFAGYDKVPEENDIDTWIDDTKNGYLEISSRESNTPTMIVGAYRKADGNYMLLRYNYDDPGYSMTTNESFASILPPEINLEFFYKKGTVIDTTRTYYTIDIEIPRKGTETVLYLTPALLIDEIAYNKQLQFSNIPDDSWADFHLVVEHLILGLIDVKLVDIVNQDDRMRILERIREKLPEEYVKTTAYLCDAYLESKKIVIRSVVMDWDREAGRFYTKKINEQQENYNDFVDFLIKREALPNNSRAYFNVGFLYEHQNKHDQAIDCYQKVINHDPDFAQAYYNLGYIHAAQGNADRAIEYYQKTIDLNPNYAEAYDNLGNIYSGQGNYNQALECHQKAIECYQKANDNNPNMAWAYNNMGNTYYSQGKYSQAMECYQKAIDLDPNHANAYASAYSNMGVIYDAEGNYSRAIECFQRAIDGNPNIAEPYNNIGYIYFNQGKYTQAIKWYQKAIDVNPNYARAYSNMGASYEKLDNMEKVIESYRKAAALGNEYAQKWMKEKGYAG